MVEVEKYQSGEIICGDVRSLVSIQHNVASVKHMDGESFFREYITASQTLQVSLIVHSAVNQNQPQLWGPRQSSAKKRKLLMEMKVLLCPKGSPLLTRLM